jgi:hypothetical protein
VQNSPRTGHYPPARPDLSFRPVAADAIAEAVARELPDAGEDVPARVTALLARFASQGIVS